MLVGKVSARVCVCMHEADAVVKSRYKYQLRE
jgi:hypothetical protein